MTRPTALSLNLNESLSFHVSPLSSCMLHHSLQMYCQSLFLPICAIIFSIVQDRKYESSSNSLYNFVRSTSQILYMKIDPFPLSISPFFPKFIVASIEPSVFFAITLIFLSLSIIFIEPCVFCFPRLFQLWISSIPRLPFFESGYQRFCY